MLGLKTVSKIPLNMIDTNPAQPRMRFNGGEIASLADSIAQNGLISPITVRKLSSGRYQLIAGERRLRAFFLLGESSIPALVEKIDDRAAAVLALVENLQRSDLNFYEQALAIKRLLAEQGLTQQQLAKSLGMSQPGLANKLRILRLPPPLLEKMCDAGLTERHARALLPLCEDKRLHGISEQVINNALTVEKTEKIVSKALENNSKNQKKRLLILKDLRIFNVTIQKAVSIMQQAGISAVSETSEDENNITYTITVSKHSKFATSSRVSAV